MNPDLKDDHLIHGDDIKGIVLRELTRRKNRTEHEFIKKIYERWFIKLARIDINYEILNKLAPDFYREIYKEVPNKEKIERVISALRFPNAVSQKRMTYDVVRSWLIHEYNVIDFRFV